MGTLRHQRARARGETGAALVEFALVFPIFMMIVLGMFSGGQAYNRKLTLTNAAREGSRYGATLPVNNDMGAWLRSIAIDVRDNATGELDDGTSARRICVAYVFPNGTTANDSTRHLVVTAGSIPATVTPAAGRCTVANGSEYVDGMANGQRRVNVVTSRSGKIQALFWTTNLHLEARSATRFEATL